MKLHLGCGKRYLSGYTHIDIGKYDHIDYRSDVSELPFIEAESVELIYASHVLEYFDREEVKDVLENWRSKLITGGTLRLAVPDFEQLIKVYKIANLGAVLGPLYGKWAISENTIYHKTVYDFDSLSGVLEDAGFVEIHRWDWRKVFTDELAGFDDHSQAYYPHMEKALGTLVSLNIEARK